jgi:hypothetical protein
VKTVSKIFFSTCLCLGANAALARSAINSEFLHLAKADIETREYALQQHQNMVIVNNRKLGLRGVFDAEGLLLADRESGNSALRLRLESFGRSNNMVLVNQHLAKIQDGRVELDRGNVREWFVNSPSGIEQGFDIDSKPGGLGELELHIDTDHAVPSLDADGVTLQTASQQLRYNKLKAWDANGTILPSSMRVQGDNIVLSIDDSKAVYPIVVDPLLSAVADGTLVSSQASAQFGHDAANVGDVNGDGYEDIVVTAYGFDGTVGINEGGWFLYLGGETVNAVTDGSGLGLQVDARMGSSVAGVGDVNGDGYADFVVGAEMFDITPNGNEGRAYLYLGGATFNSVADATFQESQTDGNFGSDVAGAGDVDGDGYNDILIAAENYNGGAVDSGSVFLYEGGPTVNSVSDATLTSNLAGIRFGTSVAGAGDVNADGFADIIIGAPEFESAVAENNEGLAVLYLGASTFNTTADASYQINQSEARLGESVAGLGDVNGDSFGDFLLGARLHDLGASDSGAAFLYFGAASPPVSPSPSLSLTIGQNTAHFGAEVAAAGDINADGYADFLIGAPLFDNGSSNEGASYVYLGGSTVANTFYRRLEVNQIDAQLGRALAGGDFNGDGYSDVYSGSPAIDTTVTDGGQVQIFFGGALDPDATREANIPSTQAAAQLGRAVATGDVNGDGFTDLVTGESGFDIVGGTNAGRILIFFGGEGGFNGSADDSITGTADSRLGSSLSVGDLNGDGFADILAGAPDYTNGETLEGSAQIFYANSAGLFPSTPDVILQSNRSNTLLGASVAIAGDIDGDGDNDIMLGAPGFDATNLTDQGAIYIHLNQSGFTATPSGVITGGQAGGAFGGAVSSAGDVNGDGFADFMAGGSGFDAIAIDAGEMRLFQGAAVFDVNADFTKDGGNLSMRFGSCLAHTDLNGDGFSDVFVGAPNYNSGIFTESGAGFIYLGTANGLDNTPLARIEMGFSQVGARFGSACHGVGDVNGDGLGDFYIGAPSFDTTLADAGATFLLYGSNPFNAGPALRLDAGATAQAASGTSVAGGDFNGDGYADVAIGVVSEDNGATVDTGAISVYFGNTVGRRIAARTVDANGTRPIEPWGNANSANQFLVSAFSYGSNACEQAKLEVQACSAGLAFGSVGCVSRQSPNWSPIVSALTRIDVNVPVAVGLHHWRARLRYRSCNPVTSPVAPRVGPWRRTAANANLSDVRTLDALFKNGFE